jgi:hypothetical protein
MAHPWYVTRDTVKDALDVKATARSDRQVDRAIEAASRTVEGVCHRRFYPWSGTRRFDWPNSQRARPWRLWLDANELISITMLVAGGVTIPSSDYLLYPTDGPPYNRVEIDLSSSAAFASGATHQQAIVITGVWGYRADEEQIGSLTSNLDADITDTASVTWTVTDLGVGDILRVDDERLIVTARTMSDSGQNTAGALSASAADVTVPVADGTAFGAGSVLLVGAERMLVVDVAGNNLAVKRGWDGSVLAAHSSNSDVYSLAGMDVDRAQLGTTLAAHLSGAAVYRHTVPGLVRDATAALALAQVLGEQSGYARPESKSAPSGSATSSRPRSQETGRGVASALCDLYDAYGRKARTRAV